MIGQCQNVCGANCIHSFQWTAGSVDGPKIFFLLPVLNSLSAKLCNLGHMLGLFKNLIIFSDSSWLMMLLAVLHVDLLS